MKKEKINNVKVSNKIIKLIGTVILVDSLVIGVTSLGGHTPIYQDDKKIYQVNEIIYTDYSDGSHEIEVCNYYQDQIDTRNKVIYYKKPYSIGKEKYREIETIYKDKMGPVREYKTVRVSNAIPDDDSYVETYEYDINTNNYITVKETLHDELLSDVTLLLILGSLDTGMIAAGMSYINREEEEKNKELELKKS